VQAAALVAVQRRAHDELAQTTRLRSSSRSRVTRKCA
jgi:hypothetical protein